jgi:carboxyl-terminal processing protease
MEQQSTKTPSYIYQPLIYSAVLIAGILIGIFLFPSKYNNLDSSNKINSIISLVRENYVDTVNREQMLTNSINGMLQNLDPHSVYIPAEELTDINDQLDGDFEGIGIQFNIQNDTVMVVSTISKGPSEKVGIIAGDRIVTVDGKVIAGKKIATSDVMKLLKGKKGTKVTVGIKRSGIKQLTNFTIQRDVIPTYSIDASYMADNTTGYIKISQFAATTAEEFEKASGILLEKGMKEMILDLRGNPGGYMDAAVQIVDEFLPSGKLVVSTKGRKYKGQTYKSTSDGKLEFIKLVVLIDEWSASASEIVAGAIQDNDRGVIIGRRSFGKGLVQNQYPLKDGSALRLTVARYYTPSGRCIQKPYKGSIEDYYEDLLTRIEHGELEHPDSIHFVDSLKFLTTAGRVVYGGGGIMPDVFIPLGKNENNGWFNALFNMGLINQFAFKYIDDNRKEIKSKYTEVSFVKQFTVDDALFEQLVTYAEKAGLKKDTQKIAFTKLKTKAWLKAFIGRNIFGDKAFYPVWLSEDETFKKALDLVKKNSNILIKAK